MTTSKYTAEQIDEIERLAEMVLDARAQRNAINDDLRRVEAERDALKAELDSLKGQAHSLRHSLDVAFLARAVQIADIVDEWLTMPPGSSPAEFSKRLRAAAKGESQ